MTWDDIEALEWSECKHTAALATRLIQAILTWHLSALTDRGAACCQINGTDYLGIRKVEEYEFRQVY